MDVVPVVRVLSNFPCNMEEEKICTAALDKVLRGDSTIAFTRSACVRAIHKQSHIKTAIQRETDTERLKTTESNTKANRSVICLLSPSLSILRITLLSSL